MFNILRINKESFGMCLKRRDLLVSCMKILLYSRKKFIFKAAKVFSEELQRLKKICCLSATLLLQSRGSLSVRVSLIGS